MDAMNDILRSFRTEYRKTPVKLKVCHYNLLDVRDCFTTFVITAGARLFFGLHFVYGADSGPFRLFLVSSTQCDFCNIATLRAACSTCCSLPICFSWARFPSIHFWLGFSLASDFLSSQVKHTAFATFSLPVSHKVVIRS